MPVESETSRGREFEAKAQKRSAGPLGEFVYFLRRSRKWWMAPIIVMLVLVGVLLVMTSSAVAPLIYALF